MNFEISRYIPISLLIFFTSCTFDIYRPNSVFVPLIKEEGQIVAEGTFGTSGYGASIAASPIKSLYIMASGAYYHDQDRDTLAPSRFVNRKLLLEGGAGYYLVFGDEKQGVFEVASGLGAGIGDAFNRYGGFMSTDIDRYAEGNFFKAFLQPSIGLAHHIIHVAGSIRVSYLHFYNYNYYEFSHNNVYQSYPYNKEPIVVHQDLNKSFNQIYIDPTVTIRAGYKYVYFHSQFGLSFTPVEDEKRKKYFSAYPLILNIGVTVNLPLKELLKPKLVGDY